MDVVRISAVAAAVAVGLTLAAPGADAQKKASKCVMAAGEGTGAGETIAKAMADAALKSSIKNYGGTPSGEVSYKCAPSVPFLTTCTAAQKVCK